MTLARRTLALQPLLPEITLAVGGMLLLMLGAYAGDRVDRRGQCAVRPAADRRRRAGGVAAGRQASSLFNGSFVVDLFARFMKVLALAGSAIAILMSLDYMKAAGQRRFEYPILVVFSTLGMLLLVSAGDLIALYLGLELMSLCLYVLAAFHRDIRARFRSRA